MKKPLVIVTSLALLLVLAFAAMAVAAPPAGTPLFCNQANLTDAQKEELAPLIAQMKDLRTQMFEVRKQMIQKQVEFGNLTQEQADQRITRMQQRIDQGFPGGRMHGGHGMMRGGAAFGPGQCQQQQPATN